MIEVTLLRCEVSSVGQPLVKMTDKGEKMSGQLRQIAPQDWARQRFSWMSAVRRDHGLTMTERLIADTLVMEFANRDTMRCDPSVADIIDVIGGSIATIKRGIKALESAGWIARKPGRGRSKKSQIVFLSRAQIVPLKGVTGEPLKGVTGEPHLQEKGSLVSLKGVTGEPPYIKDKPCKNHKSAREGKNGRFSEAEQREARRLVRWLERGGDPSSESIPKHLISCAVAHRIVEPAQLAIWGIAWEGDGDV